MSLKAQQQNNDNTLLAQNNPPPPPGALPGTTSGQQPATTTESGINPNYKLPSFDSVLKTTSDFSAGAGDFLSGGLTTKINNATGASSVVDTNSGSYKAGVITGVGLTVATSAAGAVTSQAVGAGKYGMVYGRGGNALLNSGKVRFGWYWTGARDAVGLRIGEGLNTLHIPFWHP
jgi:hypothetical protein